MAEQVDDAGLDRRLGKDGQDCLGEALQPVDDGEQHVLHAPVAELVHDPEPELRALVLLEPEPENLLGAVGADAEGDMHGLVADQPLVADLDPQGVEEDERIDRLEGARLPQRHLVQHRVRDRADQVGRGVDAIEVAQMTGDLAHAHATRVHRDDLLVKAGKAALVPGDQLRVEAGLAVPRDLQLELARVGRHRLSAVAVAGVAGLAGRQMMVHLGVQRPLGESLLQLVE